MRNHWIGIALLGSVALLGATPAAWGQIAAPSIVPGTFSSENPAAIKWGAPSRFGLAAVGQRTTSDPGNQQTDFGGGLAGLRLVGESLALGIELANVTDQESTLKDIREYGSAAIALQTGNSIAWGLGYNAFKQTTDTFEVASKEPTFGISLRLGEVWFLGGVIGRESVTQKDLSGLSPDFYGDRDTFRAGLGFRSGGTVLVHTEVFGISKPDLETKFGKFAKEDTAGGTLEFTFWSFLIGGSGRHTEYKHAGIDSEDRTTGDLGWAPRQGLSITLHYESRVVEYKNPLPGSPETTKDELGAVVFTWLF